eukprot:COSAG06_NODE_10785_length_1616_cov_2.926170_1_plen_67_part_00
MPCLRVLDVLMSRVRYVFADLVPFMPAAVEARGNTPAEEATLAAQRAEVGQALQAAHRAVEEAEMG